MDHARQTLPIYQVDAFAGQVFKGNPAAVCPLPAWLDDATLRAIAAENNLSETAFFVPNGDHFDIKWFTPTVEVELCGHATLASAFVIMNAIEPGRSCVTFQSQSGLLTAKKQGEMVEVDLPSRRPEPVEPREDLSHALRQSPRALWSSSSGLLAIFEHEDEIATLRPDMALLKAIKDTVTVTAPGKACDFVSRFFAPAYGIDEDPVTGSAHCTLGPYWRQRLNKTKLFAKQLSRRGGELWLEDQGDRVRVAGHAALYLKGEIYIDSQSA